jgi:hypothetical protein
MRFLYRSLVLPLDSLWLSPLISAPQKEIGEIAMADMDEGSKGGRRSVLAFGIVAAVMTVLLIVIGVTGKNVAQNTAQSNTESPATSGSQNP